MGKKKYVFDSDSFKVGKAERKGRKVAVTVLKLFFASISLTVVYYVFFSLFFSTDKERALQNENRMLERMYPEMEKKAALLDDVVEGLKIRDGKIIWIDMGMMGRLTEHDREMIGKAVQGVALSDVGLIQQAVMALGEFKTRPDQRKLYEDIDGLLMKYGNVQMGQINVAEVMTDLMEVMKNNKIKMPHGLTMLARGLTHMEGVLADIAPDINMVEIATAHVSGEFFRNFDLKKELKSSGKSIAKSFRKALDIPSLVSDMMHGYLKGQAKVNLDLQVTDDLAQLLRRLVRNIVMGLWVMALLISSSIICTTDMTPKVLGIPALGAFGYLLAFVIVLYVFIKHMISRK